MNDERGGRPTGDDGRATVTVQEAAAFLERSTSRVHQLLKDPDAPLAGPGPPGRGRNRRTGVYADTLDAQKAKQDTRRRRSPASIHSLASLARRLEMIESRLTDLAAAVVAGIDREQPPAEAVGAATAGPSRSDLRWAVRQLNAAAEALHAAASQEAVVRKHQRNALESLNKALALQDQATADVRRSDQLRSDVIGVLLAPNDPGEI
jgi:hypothetical protein